tara:strand:+ start:1810 stop:2082 length:273 start_codon:yes stop_codon:yes gene_type:complete
MDPSQLQTNNELSTETLPSSSSLEEYGSLEAEIPETLYVGMKSFIAANPQWDQYVLISSALANFLFQNGCTDRAVTERYLNDIFNLSNDQ